MSGFGKIAMSTLLLKDILLVPKNLLDGMINQGSSKYMLSRLNRYPEAFQKCHILALHIVSEIAAT